jgi:hypothetical protein
VSDGEITADGFYFDDFEITILGDSLTSIKSINANSTITLIPNPSKDYFYLSNKTTPVGSTLVSIHDVYGKLLKSHTIMGDYNNVKISTEELNVGTYFVRINNNNNFSVEKLVIVR